MFRHPMVCAESITTLPPVPMKFTKLEAALGCVPADQFASADQFEPLAPSQLLPAGIVTCAQLGSMRISSTVIDLAIEGLPSRRMNDANEVRSVPVPEKLVGGGAEAPKFAAVMLPGAVGSFDSSQSFDTSS